MSAPVAVATIAKNASEEVRVTLDTFKDVQLVDIRVFGQFTAAKAMMPTKKGASLNVAKLPELIRALQAAEVTAREMGWIGGVQ